MTTKWLGAAAWSAREAHAGDRLPYARLVDPQTLLLRDGALMGALQVPGLLFETEDTDALNQHALTRPQMFAGVTYNFFIINAAVTTELFLVTGSFFALPAALVIHGIGYFACLREPRIFDLWLTKVSKCPRVRNWKRWGCNSYAA